MRKMKAIELMIVNGTLGTDVARQETGVREIVNYVSGQKLERVKVRPYSCIATREIKFMPVDEGDSSLTYVKA